MASDLCDWQKTKHRCRCYSAAGSSENRVATLILVESFLLASWVMNSIGSGENNIVTGKNNILVGENNIVTDQNNILTDENNIITD